MEGGGFAPFLGGGLAVAIVKEGEFFGVGHAYPVTSVVPVAVHHVHLDTLVEEIGDILSHPSTAVIACSTECFSDSLPSGAEIDRHTKRRLDSRLVQKADEVV